MATRGVWYKKIGSDDDLVEAAIAMARVRGSVGSEEIYLDTSGEVLRFATVRREGFQENDYVLV